MATDTPETTYQLSVIASGNGYATYNGTSIRNGMLMFSVAEGTNATLTFSPDAGYRIAAVKVNGSMVSVNNNQYTISNITSSTSVSVVFEQIPPTYYNLTLTVSGNGSATYNGTSVRKGSQTFSVTEGSNTTITFSPDVGYRIAAVKVNGSTVSVNNNQYTVSNITSSTSVSVVFEQIPPTYYNLTLTASGNGSATLNGTSVRNGSQTFSVTEGSNTTITFSPDNGYRVKSVKVNNTTVSISNNQYTVNNISSNTTVAVEFEVIPSTTYTLTIKATGNGTASYNGTTVRGNTKTFTVNKGTNATIAFSPDYGYRVKSVKVNNNTVSISSNQYAANNISRNTTIEVEFEVNPSTTYNLTIKATGKGSVIYEDVDIRDGNQNFSVAKGKNITIMIRPDQGYRIASVKVNNEALSVLGNTLSIVNNSSDKTVEVVFEAIPVTTYTLTIKATGKGSVTYDDVDIRDGNQAFTVANGKNATIMIWPDQGYRIASVKVNNEVLSVSGNTLSIVNISSDKTVEVVFEAIPVTTYTLTIKASGNGTAAHNGTTVRNGTRTFTVNEGTNATITFNPDNGYQIKSVKVNNSAVSVSNNRYTVSNIRQNTTVEVIFEKEEEVVTEMNVNGRHFDVLSADEATVSFGKGNYSGYMVIPEEVAYHDKVWRVVAVGDEAFKDCKEVITVTVPGTIKTVGTNVFNGCEKLAAIVWDASTPLTAQAMGGQENPNLLLYVSDKQYAPSTIQNVIVNGTANSITLTDDSRCNTFYCPKEFTAQTINYSHRYSMTTGKGETRGWETIALPFAVQKITHQSKGTLVPFANFDGNSSNKPFWLYSYGSMGWQAVGAIDAYVPYLISMPHNQAYKADYDLAGMVTFSAQNIRVGKTPQTMSATDSYHGGRMRANFAMTSGADGKYALNVNNDLVTNTGGMTEGSAFVMDLRPIRPFEAYLEVTAETRSVIPVFDDETTGIRELENMIVQEGNTIVYDLQGRKVESPKKAGVYIMNGKKKMIK